MKKPSKRPRPDRGLYWTGAHTTHRLRYHLVWIPKYRRRVLTGAVAARLEALLRQACQVSRWGLEEMSVQPDHIRLLVQARPSETVSEVVQRLKGGTSRVLRAEFPELEEYLCSILRPVGGQLLGGRVFRGDGGEGGRGDDPRLHPPAASALNPDGLVTKIIR